MSSPGRHVLVVTGVVVGVLLIAGAALLGYAAYEVRHDLSQAPLRLSTALVPSVPESVLAFPVTLRFDQLVERLEKAAPHTFAGSGSGPPVCVQKAKKICAATQYDYSATRGAVSVSEGPAGALRITLPLSVSGHAGLKGDGAKLLHLAPKQFQAVTNAVTDVSFDMSQDWCPRMHVSTDFGSMTAQVQVAGRTSVDVTQYIKDSVQQSLAKLGTEAAGALKCDDIRHAMQNVWVTRSFPLALPGDPRALYVNVEPVSFGFSGVKLTTQQASFLMSLSARMSVGDTAIPAQTKPLPAWTPVAMSHGGLTLSIPLQISYQGLDTHLLALLKQHPLILHTPRGPGTIAVDGLNIYPSQDRIAFGVHVTSIMPDRFFDTGGWLYWTARPLLSADGRVLNLGELGYSKLGSNPLARMLTDVVDKEMQKGLAAAGQFNLTDNLVKTTEQVKSSFAAKGSQLPFDLSNATIRLGRLVLGKDALYIEAIFSTGAPDTPPANGA